PRQVGTKAAAHYRFTIPANESRTVRLRLARIDPGSTRVSRAPVGASPTGFRDKKARGEAPRTAREARALPGEELRSDAFADFDEIFSARKAEANESYYTIAPINLVSYSKSTPLHTL